MVIEFAQINDWLAQHIFPFARISGMLMAMVIIGTRTVTPRVRLFLALAITVVAMPMIKPVGPVELFSLNTISLIALQTFIGAAAGLVTRLVFETFVIAGQTIAMQTGLGFASLIDRSTGVNVPALGQMFVMIATLIFLSVDGHLELIKMIVASFDSLPITESGVFFFRLDKMVLWAESLFSSAFMMVLSAIVALLVMNLALGIMTRAAPSLNIFAIGFPIMTITGMFIVWSLMRSFLPHFINHIQRGNQLICDLLLLECQYG